LLVRLHLSPSLMTRHHDIPEETHEDNEKPESGQKSFRNQIRNSEKKKNVMQTRLNWLGIGPAARLANTVMNIPIPYQAGKFLTAFSRKTLNGVRMIRFTCACCLFLCFIFPYVSKLETLRYKQTEVRQPVHS
jgi:hypothetical protein